MAETLVALAVGTLGDAGERRPIVVSQGVVLPPAAQVLAVNLSATRIPLAGHPVPLALGGVQGPAAEPLGVGPLGVVVDPREFPRLAIPDDGDAPVNVCNLGHRLHLVLTVVLPG